MTSEEIDIKALSEDKNNKTCFDCGATDPTFASANNAVYICEKCESSHKSLKSISITKPLNGQWSADELKIMKIGGNQRLKDLMSEFGIPLDMDIDTKYKLRALDYYRNLLKSEANQTETPEKPDIISAFDKVEPVPEPTNAKNEEQAKGNNDEKKEGDSENNFFKGAANFFKTKASQVKNKVSDLHIGDKMSSLGNDIKTKVSDLHIGDKMSNFGNKTKEFATEKKNSVMNSNFVKKIKEKLSKKEGGEEKKPEGQGEGKEETKEEAKEEAKQPEVKEEVKEDKAA